MPSTCTPSRLIAIGGALATVLAASSCSSGPAAKPLATCTLGPPTTDRSVFAPDPKQFTHCLDITLKSPHSEEDFGAITTAMLVAGIRVHLQFVRTRADAEAGYLDAATSDGQVSKADLETVVSYLRGDPRVETVTTSS